MLPRRLRRSARTGSTGEETRGSSFARLDVEVEAGALVHHDDEPEFFFERPLDRDRVRASHQIFFPVRVVESFGGVENVRGLPRWIRLTWWERAPQLQLARVGPTAARDGESAAVRPVEFEPVLKCPLPASSGNLPAVREARNI